MAGRTIAVQAKCYAGSVGNAAVQEAHAGKSFYGCDSSIVITSSVFTSGAIKLANAVGCVLIDGSQIPKLIRGEIVV